MKRASILLAPPLAFMLAALLAWLTGSPVGKAVASHETGARSPRQREDNAASSGEPAAVAAQFENEMLVYRAPPKEIHDAEGMEAVFKSDKRTQGNMHGGMSWLSYSMEWAEESPVEMFAWLIHQGGSDFKERVSAASILFEKWAGKDMEAALAAVSKIPDSNLRRQALASSIEVLCQSNPYRARELLLQNLDLFPPRLEGSPFKAYGTGKTTCDLLLSLPPGRERTRLLANFLTSAARWPEHGEAANAIAVWKDAPEPLRRELVSTGFSGGKENATAFDGLEVLAREKAETSGDPVDAGKFMEAHGPAWAQRDLAGALDWTEAHLNGKNRVGQSVELFAAAARGNLDAALQRWQMLPESILKSHAAKAISENAPASRWAEVDSVMRPRPAQ